MADSAQIAASPHHPDHQSQTRWWLLSLAALVLMFLAFSIQKIWMADFWWQLFTGKWVVEHRTVPQTDFLSYTAAGRDWIEMRWLFYLLSYFCWQLGGAAAVIIAQTVTVAAAFAIITWPFRRVVMTVPGMIVLAMGINAAANRFIVRPEIFSFLFLCCYLALLHRATRRSGWLAVWLLPLIQVVWANSHTTFVLGPVVAWMYLGGTCAQVLSRTWLRWPEDITPNTLKSQPLILKLFLIAVFTTLACWVNPYGQRGALLPLLLWSEMHKGSIIGLAITEVQSPLTQSAWTWYVRVAAAMAFVTAFTFIRNGRCLDFARLGVWLAFAYLAAVAERNVALLAFVGTWATLANLQDRPIHWPDVSKRACRMISAAAHVLLASALGFLAWFVATDRMAIRYSPTQVFGLGVVEWDTPQPAIDFLTRNHVEGHIYQSIVDGCYIIWAAPQLLPVHIDGRLEVFGEEFLREFIMMKPQDWQAYADKHTIDVAILQTDLNPLLVVSIAHNPRWAPVHIDHRNLVFVRDIPRNANLIQEFRFDPDSLWSPTETDSEEIPDGWRRWLHAQGRPWFSGGLTRTFMLLASPANAMRFGRRGLEHFPQHQQLRTLLSVLERNRGNDTEANALARGLDYSPKEAVQLDRLLACVINSQGPEPGEVKNLESKIAANPNDLNTFVTLADAYSARGDRAHALEMSRRIAQLVPKSSDAQLLWMQAAERAGQPLPLVEACRAAIAVNPNFYRVHFMLASALERLDDRPAALEEYRTTLRLAPNFQAARSAEMRLQSAR